MKFCYCDSEEEDGDAGADEGDCEGVDAGLRC